MTVHENSGVPHVVACVVSCRCGLRWFRAERTASGDIGLRNAGGHG